MTPPTARRTALATATLILIAGFSAPPAPDSRAAAAPAIGAEEPPAGATTTGREPASEVWLGHFPEFPQGRLPESVAADLQTSLDAAVADGPFRGASAAVIVASAGSWSGGTGVNPNQNSIPMTAASVLPTHSVGKTVIAAQVLLLADEGKLGLDDLAADHYPPAFESATYLLDGAAVPEPSASDLHDVTIRQLLGMRSGLTDGSLPAATDPGSTPVYANVNYDVLAAIVDHVTDDRLPEVVDAGVLSRPGLDGLVFETDGARWPHDGHMRADAETMARWGYELYGGFVLSDTSLREMLNFEGQWYGLGVIDFTHPDLPSGGTYDSPSVGHGGGDGDAEVARLVAFPDEGVVVWVWATADPGPTTDTLFAEIRTLAEDFRDAAHP
jgi:CubicO group peptidase (beta-lactamase class C family)